MLNQVTKPALDASETTESERHHAPLMAFMTETLLRDVETPQTELIDSGILDSFALVELIVFLETEFSVDVDLADLEFEHFASVAKIAELIEARQER